MLVVPPMIETLLGKQHPDYGSARWRPTSAATASAGNGCQEPLFSGFESAVSIPVCCAGSSVLPGCSVMVLVGAMIPAVGCAFDHQWRLRKIRLLLPRALAVGLIADGSALVADALSWSSFACVPSAARKSDAWWR